MKKNEKGFSLVEILIVIVIVGVIIFAFLFVYNNQKNSDNETVNNTSTSQDSSENNLTEDTIEGDESLKLEYTSVELISGVSSEAPEAYGSASTQSAISDYVGFVTPEDWRPDIEFTAEGCGRDGCIGQSVIVPADEDTSTADYPDYFAVTISAFQTDQDTRTVFANNWQDAGEAAEQAYSGFMTNDGQDGFKYDFAFGGNDDQGKYTEHVAYGISKNGIVVILDVTYFNGSNNSFANAEEIDYGQQAAKVEQIAKSLRILQ